MDDVGGDLIEPVSQGREHEVVPGDVHDVEPALLHSRHGRVQLRDVALGQRVNPALVGVQVFSGPGRGVHHGLIQHGRLSDHFQHGSSSEALNTHSLPNLRSP